jgi:hypothetical protein
MGRLYVAERCVRINLAESARRVAKNLVVHRRRAGAQSQHSALLELDAKSGFRSSRPHLAACTDRRVERQVESKASKHPFDTKL